jgi:hypothetical protein
MTRYILASAAALSLAGCATALTPQRCEDALRGLNTAQQIAAVLITNGIEPARAAELSVNLAVAQQALAVACKAANPAPAP